ncbi:MULTISPECIES: hypothetical protein [unclassified Kitasatospora]|uniref:hypothetical protein n=1 Tax=unclassified Kitasatospora TaxID=2633591 RepID=UPI0038186BD3
MASVHRTARAATARAAVLLAVAALLAGPAVRLAGSGEGAAVLNGVLLSVGSVLLLTGAAFAVRHRCRPPSER